MRRVDTCINIADLDANARIRIRVMDAIEDVCVLRTELSCFGEGVLRQGRQYCLLLPPQSKRSIALPPTLQYQLSQSADPLVLEGLRSFAKHVCALFLDECCPSLITAASIMQRGFMQCHGCAKGGMPRIS